MCNSGTTMSYILRGNVPCYYRRHVYSGHTPCCMLVLHLKFCIDFFFFFPPFAINSGHSYCNGGSSHVRAGPCWSQWAGGRNHSFGGRHGNDPGLWRDLYPFCFHMDFGLTNHFTNLEATKKTNPCVTVFLTSLHLSVFLNVMIKLVYLLVILSSGQGSLSQ